MAVIEERPEAQRLRLFEQAPCAEARDLGAGMRDGIAGKIVNAVIDRRVIRAIGVKVKAADDGDIADFLSRVRGVGDVRTDSRRREFPDRRIIAEQRRRRP